MNSQEIGIAAFNLIGQFRNGEGTYCPDCETRFPLQLLVAELLRKNEMLRIELHEARGRFFAIDQD